MMNTKSNHSKGDMKVEAKSSSSGPCGKFIEVAIMLILIRSYYCFIHGYYCSTILMLFFIVTTAWYRLLLLVIFSVALHGSRKSIQFGLGQQPQPTFSFHTRPVVDEMHKEEQQAAGGPPSLGVTSKEGAHPQLSSGCDASADSTTEADPGISAPRDSIPQQQDKTESAGDGLKTTHTNSDTRSAFISLDSLEDEPIIITDESEKEEAERYEDTHTTSHDVPNIKLKQQKEKAEAEVAFLKSQHMYPNVNQLTELLVTSLKPELSKILASHVFDSSIPPELKELPSKITELSGEVKELTKNVTNTLNKIATIVKNASPKATNKSVPSADQAGASPAEGEKNTKDADKENLKQQPTTITPPNTSSFQSPLFPNPLKSTPQTEVVAYQERQRQRIYKFSFVIEGGEQIHLTVEKIEEQKRIKESLKAELAKQEVEKVKNELVDLMGTNVVTQPLKEQDPLEELNNLADKKRKRADDFKDHSNSTKKYKSSDQHKDEVH
ncbi:hypothetical protein Tco_0408712 [Tanacetum coccineum]